MPDTAPTIDVITNGPKEIGIEINHDSQVVSYPALNLSKIVFQTILQRTMVRKEDLQNLSVSGSCNRNHGCNVLVQSVAILRLVSQRGDESAGGYKSHNNGCMKQQSSQAVSG